MSKHSTLWYIYLHLPYKNGQNVGRYTIHWTPVDGVPNLLYPSRKGSQPSSPQECAWSWRKSTSKFERTVRSTWKKPHDYGWNPGSTHQLRLVVEHPMIYLVVLYYTKWCRISSINSIMLWKVLYKCWKNFIAYNCYMYWLVTSQTDQFKHQWFLELVKRTLQWWQDLLAFTTPCKKDCVCFSFKHTTGISFFHLFFVCIVFCFLEKHLRYQVYISMYHLTLYRDRTYLLNTNDVVCSNNSMQTTI